LNNLKNDKEHQINVNGLTNEIKSLVSKKHDYIQKLGNNKKSMDSLRVFLRNIKHLYKSLSDQNKLISRDVESSNIEKYITILEAELKENNEEIIEKINKSEVTLKDILNRKRKSREINNEDALDNKKMNRNINLLEKSPQRHNKFNQDLLPKIENKRKEIKSVKTMKRNNDKDIGGIFNKYEYLNSINKEANPHYMKDLINKGENITEAAMDEKNNFEIDLHFDFENTSNNDYLNLCKKRDQLEEVKLKIFKNITENEKYHEKK